MGPDGRASEPAWSAQEPARRAPKLAGRASEPGGRPHGRTETKMKTKAKTKTTKTEIISLCGEAISQRPGPPPKNNNYLPSSGEPGPETNAGEIKAGPDDASSDLREDEECKEEEDEDEK